MPTAHYASAYYMNSPKTTTTACRRSN